MLLKIQQTTTGFAKLDMKQHKTLASQAAPGFFETNREVPAFFFEKIVRFKTLTPWAKKVGQKPDLQASENVRIPGGLWSGLELVDTSGATYYVSLVKEFG